MKTKAHYAMLLMNEIAPTIIPRIRLAQMLRRARQRKTEIRKTNHSITISDLKAFFWPVNQFNQMA